MKKIKTVICVLMALSMILISGCGSVENQKEEPGEILDSSPVTSSLIQGFPSGLWFVLSTAIAESLAKTYEGSFLDITPGDSTTNLFRLEEHSVDFALTHSSIAYGAVNGNGQFDSKLKNLTSIAVFYPSAAQLIVKKDTGASSFADFIENKIAMDISIGNQTSVANIAFCEMLSEYGLEIKDLEDWGCKIYLKNMSDSEEMFADGIIDGMFVLAGAPTNAVVQMDTNDEMVMLGLDEKLVQSMVEKHGYDKFTIPDGTYSFIARDSLTFTTYSMLAASSQVSEATAYKMARSIYENIGYISGVHATLKDLSPEILVKTAGMPLHPGAAMFYREMGLID
ncbi:MAG: TAXI family TRAP transporter solute-binding subunit [Clostridia bacterium]|nr:TAXI family TRAP transporter solute-binding subunit [Clostridia bacterium]